MDTTHMIPDLTPEQQAEWDGLTEALADARAARADLQEAGVHDGPLWRDAYQVEALAISQRSRFCMRHRSRRGRQSMNYLTAREERQ